MFGSLRDAVDNWEDDSDVTKRLKESSVGDRRWVCMGLRTFQGMTYQSNPEYYVKAIQHTHWAMVRSYLYKLVPADIRLQLAFQLHQKGVVPLKK